MLPLQTAVSIIILYTDYTLYVISDNDMIMTVFCDEIGLISCKQLEYEVRVLAYT